jgi:hypothetical protein
LIISYSSLQINDVDTITEDISLSLKHLHLNPTHGLQELHVEYLFL